MDTRTPIPSPFRSPAARMSNRTGPRRPPPRHSREVGALARLRSSGALLGRALRLVPALAFVFAFAFAASADAAPKYEASFANFAKTDGYFAIKGYRFDNARTSAGQTRGSGSAQFSAITLERSVDFRSPEMLAHYAKGEIIPKVTIRFGEGSTIAFSMELRRVAIVGVSQTVSNPKKGPTELVTLSFEEVKWTARTPDGKTVKGSWKAATNK